MEQKEIRFKEKRELGIIISDSFEFLKQEYKSVSKLVFIYVLPFVLLYAAVQVWFQRNILSGIDMSDQEILLANIGPFYMNLFVLMLFNLFVQSLLAGTFYSYVEAYINKGKDKFETPEITSRFFANSLLALGANLAFFIIVMFGIIFCIVPGIYLANTLSLVVIAFIYEKKGLSDALSRSWKLVTRQWWNTFILNILGFLMVYAIGLILSIPSMLFGFGNTVIGSPDTTTVEYPDWYWILTGITAVITTILLVIPFTFQAFQYFNLSEREKPTIQIDPDSVL
ncbi:MAG: hypothetical protein ABFS16_11155 [Bacteroidota bacterium]